LPSGPLRLGWRTQPRPGGRSGVAPRRKGLQAFPFHEPLQLKNRNVLLKNILRKLAIFDHLITRFMGAMRVIISGRSFHEPAVHWNHRLTLRLTTIPPLLGERAGVRADVSSSRRDWLLSRFRVREQFPSEQATAHEPWNIRPLKPSHHGATGDDSPSPKGEGRPARRPVRRSA